MRQLHLALFLASMLSISAQTTFRFGTATNPQGTSFTVDSRSFIIGGIPVIPVMGEIHYSRVPQQDWQRELRKMKAGGITTVATYIFWNHHEVHPGQWDWSGNRNLRHFVQTCAAEGLYVVLRVGPFCHGEVYQGGFPDWIVDNSILNPREWKLRTTASGFLSATANLYNNIFAQVNGLLWKDGGPIVGLQIENECRGPWSYYAALKQLVLQAGFDLPFYTRTGWPKLNDKEVFGQMLPLYGDYADGFWDRNLRDMPGDYPKAFIMKNTRLSAVIATETFGTNQDTHMESSDLQYPYLTCELGGGMMPSYHRRINMSGREAKPLAICKLGSGSNLPGYYMYHGGTNPYSPLHSMAETQNSRTTNHNDMPLMSYDFQSPLGEMGQPLPEAYHSTRLLHQMLADWGSELSQMDIDTLSDHYSRRGSFEFYNDYVRILNEHGKSYCTLRKYSVGSDLIDWTTVEPFCRTDDGTIWFVEIPGKKPRISVNGKTYTARLDKPFRASGLTLCVLSLNRAYTAYKISGHLHYAPHSGILYPTPDGIAEEYWQTLPSATITVQQNRQAAHPRTVTLGAQKVAAMPTDSDFLQLAAQWTLSTADIEAYSQQVADHFLSISYRGDAARIYADGHLVADNFWNGKPILVRISDLIGKRVQLYILPLSRQYPIYLQAAQQAQLQQAPDGILLSLDSINILRRTTELCEKK